MELAQKKIKRTSPGFALIKTVLAIALLAMTLSVAVRLIGVSAETIKDNRKKTTALYLAKQCLEWTRNIRDTAWKQRLPWHCGFQTSSGILAEKNTLILGSGDTGQCETSFGFEIGAEASPAIIKDEEGEDLIYSRSLELKKVSDSELEAVCVITWEDESLGLTQILTDWKK